MTNTVGDTIRMAPIEHLAGIMAAGNNYITDMEAAGQRELVASEQLPVDMMGHDDEIRAMGVEFGEQTDALFMNVKLPDGWRREASDHDMWSYVVDETGTRRIAVFYKAAFYDRRAFMRPEREAAVLGEWDEVWEWAGGRDRSAAPSLQA